MSDLARTEQELHEAISEVLTRHGLMVNRWVLVTEVMDREGERALEAFTSPDLRAWDSLGLLHFILERERGAIHAAEAGGLDDGD